VVRTLPLFIERVPNLAALAPTVEAQTGGRPYMNPNEVKRWSVKRGEKVLGRFTDSEMNGFARDGKLRPTDLIQKEGEAEWVTAQLFLATPAPPPLPPPIPPPVIQATPLLINTSPRANQATPFNVPLLVGGIVGGVAALFFGMCLCCGVLGAILPKPDAGDARFANSQSKAVTYAQNNPGDEDHFMPSGEEETIRYQFILTKRLKAIYAKCGEPVQVWHHPFKQNVWTKIFREKYAGEGEHGQIKRYKVVLGIDQPDGTAALVVVPATDEYVWDDETLRELKSKFLSQ